MPIATFCRFFRRGTRASRPPYIDVSTRSTAWRLANVTLSLFFGVVAAAHVNTDDWWLWSPIFAIPSLLCASIVVYPKSIDHKLFRILCASVIVIGLIGLLYLFWIMREVTAYGYVQDPLEFGDGRNCAGLALAVVWSVICRLAAKNADSILIRLRFLILVGIVVCCIPVFGWSLCFYAPGQLLLPYCKIMFATGDKDL